MVTAARRRLILGLALPIIGGMISQNVLNLVDTYMVGSLGNAALAAVGIGSFVNFMSMAFITGLSSGVQAMAARRLGEERHSETAVPLNGGLVLVLSLAIPGALLLFFAAPYIFEILSDDPEVRALGQDYYRARIVALVAVGMNFSFRGYWNAVNLSRLYMRTLIVMHVSNVIFSYVLIFGKFGLPALGTTGAGIGTTMSTFLGTAYYFALGLKHARPGGFLRGIPSHSTMVTMLRLAVPAGLQQFFFAAGMTTFFWIVGEIGTEEQAATNVLVNLLLLFILPGLGFGLSAASLVGQALGRGDSSDARTWGWDVSKIAAGVVACLALPIAIWPQLALAPFLREGNTLDMAAPVLRLIALTIPIDAIGMVLMNALLGAGASKLVMKITVGLQWFLFLPVAWLVGPVAGGGLFIIWMAQIGYRFIQSATLIVAWQRGRWPSIEV